MLLIFNSIIHGAEFSSVPVGIGSAILHTLDVISTENTAPVGITRLRGNKKSITFTLKYDNVRKDDFDTLRYFFENNQGTRFRYKHTDVLGTKEYWCMFAMDDLTVIYTNSGLRNTTINLVTT